MDLTKFVNPNLSWKTVKKGRRSTCRHSRKSTELGNSMQRSSVLESEKLGLAVLGRRFAEKVADVPIKKRRLLLQSSSPPPRTPSRGCEGSLSPQPQTPSPHHADSEQLVDGKFVSGQWCCTHSNSKWQAIKFRVGVMNCKMSELSRPEDFSGIELLASTACSSSIDICAVDPVEESSVVEELPTPEGVDFSTAATKETIASTESDGSSLQEDTTAALQNLHDDEDGRGVKGPAPSKDDRLHWDLNVVMDEWEEPCYDLPVDARGNDSEGVHGDVLQSENTDLEGCEASDLAGRSVHGNQLLLNSKSTVVTQDGNLLEESVQAGKHDVATSDMPLPNKYTPENVSIQGRNGEPFGRTLESPGDQTSARETGTVICKTSDADSCFSKSDIVDSFLPPPRCSDLSTSTASISGILTVVIGDSRGQVDIASTSDDSILDVPLQFEPTKLMPKCDGQPVSEEITQGGFHSQKLCHGDDKLASEDPLSDCCGSSVFQDEQGHMVGGENMSKIQEGYDSPFEDGELREPIAYDWLENEVDREIEWVDYESDNVYEEDFDTVEYSVSGKSQGCRENGQIMEDGSLLEKHVNEKFGKRGLDAPGSAIEECAKVDALKKSSLVNLKESEWYQDVRVEGDDESSRKFHPENKNGHVESKARNNLLHIEGGSSSFGSHRKSTSYISRSRSDNAGDLYSRAERDFGSEKFIVRDRLSCQGRVGNEVDGPWVDSSMGPWDSRNSYGYPRPRNVINDSAAKSAGLSGHDHNQSRSYAPRGMYRPLNRRLSPADRNDSYGIHRETLPMRGFSHDRRRGRSGISPQGLRRGLEEEYHEPGSRYLERNERFSPDFNRGAHISRARRRSRSRSPIPWHLQRDRNVDARRRSPDYRPGPRLQGERFPFQRPSFSGDFDSGFVSPTRGRLSPQRNSRCFDDRKYMDDQFRGRRSPVRMFRRSQRFDSVGYPGRVKSDDYFRPTSRPGKFMQMAGRGRKYEDSSDDRRKNEDRYETMNRVRRNDSGGGVWRFKNDTDDSSEARHTRNEDNSFGGAVRRDL